MNSALSREAEVVLASGRTATGAVVGRDAATGIVVIRVAGGTPAPAPIARDAPRLGSQAIALSEDADGIARSTVANVSAFATLGFRGSPVALVELDQAVDATGAPVMNRRAEVIGVNVANAGQRALVLPAATVDEIVSALRTGRTPSHETLGCRVVPLTPRVIAEFGLTADRGVLVKAVDAGSAAERSGVRPGDIIVRIAAREIRSVADYFRADTSSVRELEIVRGSQRLALPIGRFTRD